MIVISLGNKQTTITSMNSNNNQQNKSQAQQHKYKSLTKLTTVKFEQHNRIIIGLDRAYNGVVYDFVILLGIKYQDQQFNRYAKFYPHDFNRNSYGKIQIVVKAFQGMMQKTKRYNIQLILGIYLKMLINQFRIHNYPGQYPNINSFINAHKFIINISGINDHAVRLALKQSCEIAGIQLPVFEGCHHAALSTYYVKYKKQLMHSQQICVIQFGDKASSVSVFKMQMFQDRIIQVLQYKAIRKGGYHLTKILSQFIIDKIKQQKGIDISRHGNYMGYLHSQCQKIKISIIQSQQKQGHIRIPDLPDDSTFGITLNLKNLMEILQSSILQMVKMFQLTIAKYHNIKQILVLGSTSNIPLLKNKLHSIAKQKNKNVAFLNNEYVNHGNFMMHQYQIVIFDISDAVYQVTGQQGFKRKLMEVGENIPQRKNQKTKFPAGQLQFNLKVWQNGVKIAHFLLQSRPSQSQFWLNFQINRNKLVWLYAKTDKGKIDLPANFQTLTQQEVNKQIDKIKQLFL